jgi:hypothetical protein
VQFSRTLTSIYYVSLNSDLGRETIHIIDVEKIKKSCQIHFMSEGRAVCEMTTKVRDRTREASGVWVCFGMT